MELGGKTMGVSSTSSEERRGRIIGKDESAWKRSRPSGEMTSFSLAGRLGEGVHGRIVMTKKSLVTAES